MTAARKLWTEDHQRQLKCARLEAGVSDVAFARDNAMTLRHLQQLEEGGLSAFYSESIKFDMGAKLLKRLGVELPSAVAAPEAAAPESATEPTPAQPDPAATLTEETPDKLPSPAATAATPATVSSTRTAYIVLSLVGVGLIGAGISQIPSIHQPGATQGVVQASGVSPVAAALPADLNQSAPGNSTAGLSTQQASAQATPVNAAATPAVAPVVSGVPPSMTESCNSDGASQTIVPTQPSKSADYVYITAVSDVSVCVRDAAGQITRKALQAGQSFNIPGQQPFDVTADKMHQLRVFFQGQRIWFQAEATRLRLTAATASD